MAGFLTSMRDHLCEVELFIPNLAFGIYMRHRSSQADFVILRWNIMQKPNPLPSNLLSNDLRPLHAADSPHKSVLVTRSRAIPPPLFSRLSTDEAMLAMHTRLMNEFPFLL